MTAPRDESSEVREAPSARKKPGSKPGRRPGSALGPESGAGAIATVRRQAEALRLRESGMDLREIAEELGYADPSGAYRTIQAALQTILPDATRDEYRRLEVARLDALQEAHWEAATLGEPLLDGNGAVVRDSRGEPVRYTPSQRSAAVVLRCINQRARLLGLDAPAQVNVSLQDGEMVEVGVLQVLDEEHMEIALKLRDHVAALSRLRAGAVDGAPSHAPGQRTR